MPASRRSMRPCPEAAMALPSGRVFYTQKRHVWMETGRSTTASSSRVCCVTVTSLPLPQMHRSHWSGGGARLPEIVSDAWLIRSLTSATKSARVRHHTAPLGIPLAAPERTWSGNSRRAGFDPWRTLRPNNRGIATQSRRDASQFSRGLDALMPINYRRRRPE